MIMPQPPQSVQPSQVVFRICSHLWHRKGLGSSGSQVSLEELEAFFEKPVAFSAKVSASSRMFKIKIAIKTRLHLLYSGVGTIVCGDCLSAWT